MLANSKAIEHVEDNFSAIALDVTLNTKHIGDNADEIQIVSTTLTESIDEVSTTLTDSISEVSSDLAEFRDKVGDDITTVSTRGAWCGYQSYWDTDNTIVTYDTIKLQDTNMNITGIPLDIASGQYSSLHGIIRLYIGDMIL